MEQEIKERDNKYVDLDTKFGRLHKRAKQRIQELQKVNTALAWFVHVCFCCFKSVLSLFFWHPFERVWFYICLLAEQCEPKSAFPSVMAFNSDSWRLSKIPYDRA